MALISEVRYALQDAERMASYCPSHYSLAKEIRAVALALAQLEYKEEEVDSSGLLNQLVSLMAKFPEECSLCSEAVMEILNIEDRIRRQLDASSDFAAHDIEIPRKKILHSIVIKSYPFPIARSYRKTLEVEDSEDAIERILEAFDFSYRYCAYLLVAAASTSSRGEEQRRVLQNVWRAMARPTLGFEKGIGALIKDLGEGCELPHPFFRSLFIGLQDSRNEIEQLVELRNRSAHGAMKVASEELSETRQEAGRSLGKFLWRMQCLSQPKLLYLRKPLNFDELRGQMQYEVADCTGSDDDFQIRKIFVPKESLYKNRKVCLWLEEDEEKGTPAMLVPLYPLAVVLPPTRPKDQIYLYHDYDTRENFSVFVHPFHDNKIVKSDEELCSDLAQKITHGILRNE